MSFLHLPEYRKIQQDQIHLSLRPQNYQYYLKWILKNSGQFRITLQSAMARKWLRHKISLIIENNMTSSWNCRRRIWHWKRHHLLWSKHRTYWTIL